MLVCGGSPPKRRLSSWPHIPSSSSYPMIKTVLHAMSGLLLSAVLRSIISRLTDVASCTESWRPIIEWIFPVKHSQLRTCPTFEWILPMIVHSGTNLRLRMAVKELSASTADVKANKYCLFFNLNFESDKVFWNHILNSFIIRVVINYNQCTVASSATTDGSDLQKDLKCTQGDQCCLANFSHFLIFRNRQNGKLKPDHLSVNSWSLQELALQLFPI